MISPKMPNYSARNPVSMATNKGADVYFRSPPGRVGLTTWKGFDGAKVAGYKHARKRLAEVGAEGVARITTPG